MTNKRLQTRIYHLSIYNIRINARLKPYRIK